MLKTQLKKFEKKKNQPLRETVHLSISSNNRVKMMMMILMQYDNNDSSNNNIATAQHTPNQTTDDGTLRC
jgi:hypothetical protein